MLTVKKITLWLGSLCLILSCTCIAADSHSSRVKQNHFLLQKIAQAPQTNNAEQWLKLVEQPGNSQHYYLANKQGKIYQLEQDTPQSTSLLLDLTQHFSQEPILHLSAFTLHPNFSKRDQLGFATFYTAHVEKAPNSSETVRLHESTVSERLSFDAVITEWQLTTNKIINPATKREVMRIAIPSPEHDIQQLSFNPYSKSWHEDFSQLYISLPQNSTLKQYPLYSGVILRILPQKSTYEGYTVLPSNPYYANEKIEKSIYLLGAGKIQQFIWPEKHSTNLLISHLYGSDDKPKQLLSYSDGGDDWREQAPKEIIYQSKQVLSPNSLLVYLGQNAPALRNKLLLLTHNKKQWQLNSLSDELITDQNDIKPQQNELIALEWRLKQPALLAQQLSIYRDSRGELLFFNKDTGAIYQLFQQDNQIIQKNNQGVVGGIAFFFIILLALLVGYLVNLIYTRKKSAKSLVRSKFSALSLTEDKLAINLFKRHQHKAEKIIYFADIHQCQLLLGDLVISTINTKFGHGFNENQEFSLREIFHAEQIDKMVDGKVRRISLVINTGEKNNHTICLYLRKGSDRITKNSYFEVVDDVINWCWQIAKEINSEQTPERSLKPKSTVAEMAPTEHKSHDGTPLHTQAAVIRPATHKEPAVKPFDRRSANKNTRSQKELLNSEPRNDNNNTRETAKVETDLVNAIEKLVKLQQQGFLSPDEFTQAKAKLLMSLQNTE
jgi:hypothetical protein